MKWLEWLKGIGILIILIIASVLVFSFINNPRLAAWAGGVIVTISIVTIFIFLGVNVQKILKDLFGGPSAMAT